MPTLTFTATTDGAVNDINWAVTTTGTPFLTVDKTSTSISGNKSTAVVTYSVADGYALDQANGTLTCTIKATASDKTGGSGYTQCPIKGKVDDNGGGGGDHHHIYNDGPFTCSYSCGSTGIMVCLCGDETGHAPDCAYYN